ncbi:hypothetical protein [Erythrobacter sp. HL-111]|nr:hypothetical protein [Erythrobacter sp. HL-111]
MPSSPTRPASAVLAACLVLAACAGEEGDAIGAIPSLFPGSPRTR